ncbi:ATPase inhibitor, mitochondrial [Anolis sagrei]|uniref:ATPase inhibitor, mitochondrial n=1 Tax=Anolis sagrei TaxID=38937 RepID=UPI00295AA632|nr:ATPase inhibitor, mitochondrial [Anolis sagrei ordinatus]
MAVVGSVLRCGLRGAMALPQQQRAWSSNGGPDQFGPGKSGAIREAGGTFGKKEAAEEERYFRKLQQEQLSQLRKHHEEEIGHHKKEIERLQKEIERHKSKIKKLDDD